MSTLTSQEEQPTVCGSAEPNSLAAGSCEPCRTGMGKLGPSEIQALLVELGNEWTVVDGHHLQKSFAFPNFAGALAFVVHVGALAEAEGHHPDLFVSWGLVRIDIWTHKANGLTRSDFVLAAKCDQARAPLVSLRT